MLFRSNRNASPPAPGRKDSGNESSRMFEKTVQKAGFLEPCSRILTLSAARLLHGAGGQAGPNASMDNFQSASCGCLISIFRKFGASRRDMVSSGAPVTTASLFHHVNRSLVQSRVDLSSRRCLEGTGGRRNGLSRDAVFSGRYSSFDRSHVDS